MTLTMTVVSLFAYSKLRMFMKRRGKYAVGEVIPRPWWTIVR